MTRGKDRVGVIFYDKNTYPNFSVYVPLTDDLSSVKNSISGYTRTDTVKDTILERGMLFIRVLR